MREYKLKVDSAIDILEKFQKVFNAFNVVTRDCVKACNVLVYNLELVRKDANILRSIIFLLMNGFNTNDGYLRNYIHVVLMHLSRYSRETKFAINYTLKDLDNPKLEKKYHDVALRSLFSILPESMYYDFEKYIQRNEGCGLIIAYEFFRQNRNNLKFSNNIATETIRDYHAAYFGKTQIINKYSGIVEVERCISKRHEEIGGYLFVSTEPTLFVAACRALTAMKPEAAAPYVDKAVDVLRVYAAVAGIEAFCATRYLSRMATSFAKRVARANEELGELVRASQRCIAMISIVTLLRTGTVDTVARLGTRLEPYMATMPDNYKRTAIDTMEGLLSKSGSSSVSAYQDYCNFLKRRLIGKCGLPFKRYILDKLQRQLNRISDKDKNDKLRNSIIDFLCGYLEDPEFYEVSVDILGILGSVLKNPRDIVHVYNRLVLDNIHVQRAAVQALYNIGADIKYIYDWTVESEMHRICKFLLKNNLNSVEKLKLDELKNRVQEDIIKYLPESYWPILDIKIDEGRFNEKSNYLNKTDITEEIFNINSTKISSSLIKECRKIYLNKPTDDFYISVTKRIFSDRVIIITEIENKIQDIEFCAGLLRFETERRVYSNEITNDLFIEGTAIVETELSVIEGDIVYGIFEYKVRFDEEIDKDHCSLDTFDINIFDYIIPVPLEITSQKCTTIRMNYNCKSVEAATRIADIANMHLIADRKAFVLSGKYNDKDVLIKVTILEAKDEVTVVMDIYCDDDDIISKILKIFD